MERAQWKVLCGVLRRACRSARPPKRARYSDYLVARLYFWAVLHDRPMTWAVGRDHYTRWFRPRKVPSVSQLNRRVAADRFQAILQRAHERLAAARGAVDTLYVDGKPVNVSPVSGDRDARPGQIGRGYKLHAVVTNERRIPVFCVLPLNRHEMPVARAMLARLPGGPLLPPGTVVLADGNYDAADLHKDVDARGGVLVTRPRGRARHPVTRRQMGRARRALIDLWDRAPGLMERVYRQRAAVERVFGRLACTPGLLGPLPPSVRGLARVRRWVGAKICLYHARLDAERDARSAGV